MEQQIRDQHLPLALTSWNQEELDAIQQVIKRDTYSMNEAVFEFERQFAKAMGGKFAVMVNSGSSANLAAIAALFYTKERRPLQRGEEVIVPAVSWSTTYYPLYQYGLKIKFVDIDLETLNFDLKSLKEAITPNTRAIFAVNLLGNSNDFIAIKEMIANKDILLLEDNCESMGAKFQGQMTGAIGLMGTYSCFFSHHISTMEGGLVLTDDEELHHILLCLRAHGWTRNLPEYNKITGQKDSDPFEESFKFVLPGYNLRPLEMSGAIGQIQLKKLSNFVEQRRENARYFQNFFKGDKRFWIQKEIGESSWFGFSFILKPEFSGLRKKLMAHLREYNIDTRPIVTGNFAKNEVVKNYFDYTIHGELKNAQYLDENGFFVGNHHVPMEPQISYLAKVLENFQWSHS